jgi:hypothetical protein
MRADLHYVEQFTGSSSQPVRLICVPEFHVVAGGAAAPQPLIESIRRHGILQPLLVRQVGERFEVIAGRKRLVAAATLGLRAVPCLLHDVSDAELSALAAADNVRSSPADTGESFSYEELASLLSTHMAGVLNCAQLCDGDSALDSAALDLLKGHARLAARVLDAANLVRNGSPLASRGRPLFAILADVADGFAEGVTSVAVEIRLEAPADVTSARFNSSQVFAGVSGALLAVIPLADKSVRPSVEIRISATTGGDIAIQISQTSGSVSARVAERFFEPDSSRPGGIAAAIGALAATALARAHGGAATFEALPKGGRLVIVLPRPS